MHKIVNLLAVTGVDNTVTSKDGASMGSSPTNSVLSMVIWDVWPSLTYSVSTVNPTVTSPSVKRAK